MGLLDQIEIAKEVSKGGAWIRSVRKWMQSNLKNGDQVLWNSKDEMVTLSTHDLEELAKRVAIDVLVEERGKKDE